MIFIYNTWQIVPVSPTFTPGGWGDTLLCPGSGINLRTTPCAMARLLGQTMECFLPPTQGNCLCSYFNFLLLFHHYVQGMENQIFWSEMGYVLQIACCTLPLELPEYPSRIITTETARHGTVTKFVDYEWSLIFPQG